jgi:dihydroorotate dehydrogenase
MYFPQTYKKPRLTKDGEMNRLTNSQGFSNEKTRRFLDEMAELV